MTVILQLSGHLQRKFNLGAKISSLRRRGKGRSNDDIQSWFLFFILETAGLESWFWHLPLQDVAPEFVREIDCHSVDLLNWKVAMITFLLGTIGIYTLLWMLLFGWAFKLLVDRMADSGKKLS